MLTDSDVDAIADRLSDRMNERMTASGATSADFSIVFERLSEAAHKVGEFRPNSSGLTPAQAALMDYAVESMESLIFDTIALKAQQKRSSRVGPKSEHGVNASRLLLFVMDHESVEEKVGDALERLPEVQRSLGPKFGVWHYRWTILSLFFQAIWKRTALNRLLEVIIARLGGQP